MGLQCSFCGATGHSAGCTFCHGRRGGTKLVASSGDPPRACICNRCIELIQQIVNDDGETPPGAQR